jgi:hypothetical protein
MPDLTISVAASGDDGTLQGSGATWPPPATAVDSAAIELYSLKWLTGGTYYFWQPAMRFDTSPLPDNAVVTAAILRLYIISRDQDDDNRSLSIGYFPSSNWPLGTEDYLTSDATDAHAGTDLTSLSVGALNDFALTNLANISKTGYTGFRLTTTGGAPSGGNNCVIAALEHATLQEPQLIITFENPTNIDYSGHPRYLRADRRTV